MKCGLLNGLALVCLLFSASFVSADDESEKQAILSKVTMDLTEKYDDFFDEFSDLAMKKYCPKEYRNCVDALSELQGQIPNLKKTDRLDAKEFYMKQFIGKCEGKENLNVVLRQFAVDTTLAAAEILAQFKTLLDNPELDLSLEERIEKIEMMHEVMLLTKFNPQVALTRIEANYENYAKAVAFDLMERYRVNPYLPISSVDQKEEKKETRAELDICQECNKKSIHQIHCKCGKHFCMKHYAFDKHRCTHDAKREQREKLEKNNPVVKATQIEGI